MTSFLLLPACSPVESGKTEDCILEEIRFDEFNTLKLTTISGGSIYQIRQEFTYEGETKVVASFQFTYYKDSLIVRDQLYPDPQNTPYLSVKSENGRPIRVIKYFAASAVKLIHNISYPSDDLIRTDLIRLASTGDRLHVGYSEYHLDSNGNVVRNARYGINEDNPGEFELYHERHFSYDAYDSPQQKLFLPFFAAINHPDVKFFSSNNILSYEEEGRTFNFGYEYGEDGNILAQYLPNGQEINFGYVNCSEE